MKYKKSFASLIFLIFVVQRKKIFHLDRLLVLYTYSFMDAKLMNHERINRLFRQNKVF
jgi:hypothetical protein